MKTEILRVAQYVDKHPVLAARERYKRKYINTLEYFVRKYSEEDLYANELLNLYKEKILSMPINYTYKDGTLKKVSRGVISVKSSVFFLYKIYRYCLLIDAIFICSYLDSEKSKKIYNEILEINAKRHWKKLEEIFDYIVGENINSNILNSIDFIRDSLMSNRKFINCKEKKILVTANMSAGKSTLLNSIIGKKINKTQNDACTSKIHYLFNKAFEDNLSYEYDHELKLDAGYNELMNDNESNKSNEIYVGTRFRSIEDINSSVCFIDTPGVNSSQDRIHRDISEQMISANEYDTMMYVMNGENIGTEDDMRHLEFVFKNFKGKIIFVINKLDRFRKEDSIFNTLEQVKKDLNKVGFINPIICPVSAYAAYLAKMSLFGEVLNDDEQDELDSFYRKLKREKYRLNTYYADGYKDFFISKDKNEQLLLYSGILSLEKILYEER